MVGEQRTDPGGADERLGVSLEQELDIESERQQTNMFQVKRVSEGQEVQ